MQLILTVRTTNSVEKYTFDLSDDLSDSNKEITDILEPLLASLRGGGR